jgi:hypothetical protein
VDQIIAVIQQNPFGVLISLDARRIFAQLLQLDLDFVGDGLNLAGVGTAADDEKVGEGGYFAKVEDLDIFGLLRLGGLNRGEPKIFGSWLLPLLR